MANKTKHITDAELHKYIDYYLADAFEYAMAEWISDHQGVAGFKDMQDRLDNDAYFKLLRGICYEQ